MRLSTSCTRVLFGATGVLIVLLAAGGEAVQGVLRYERAALPWAQMWRWGSAHLVHLGMGHALLNVAGLLLIVLLFERRIRCAGWALVLAGSVAAIDAGLWFFQPQIAWYVGLSGALHGLFAAGALAEWLAGHRAALWLLLGLAAKLAYEQIGGPLPLTAEAAGGPVIVSAHLYGALGGALAYVVMHFSGRLRGASNR